MRVHLRCDRFPFVVGIEPYRDVSFLTFFGFTSTPLTYTSLSLCSCFLFETFRATTFQSSAVRFLRNFHFEKRSSYCALLLPGQCEFPRASRGLFSSTYLAENWCAFAISSLTFSSDRFLSRYNVRMMPLNGSQMGSTELSGNEIDMTGSFVRLRFTQGEEKSLGGILKLAAAVCYLLPLWRRILDSRLLSHSSMEKYHWSHQLFR